MKTNNKNALSEPGGASEERYNNNIQNISASKQNTINSVLKYSNKEWNTGIL